jgi:hypothetical protein
MTDFWDFSLRIVEIFFFVAYLMVLFHIVVDLFRDREVGGFAKAVWLILLIFFPFITAIVYLIARGQGMAERQLAVTQRAKAETDAYIRQVAGQSPAAQIADAKALLDAGTINRDEFERLKARALA